MPDETPPKPKRGRPPGSGVGKKYRPRRTLAEKVADMQERKLADMQERKLRMGTEPTLRKASAKKRKAGTNERLRWDLDNAEDKIDRRDAQIERLKAQLAQCHRERRSVFVRRLQF